MLRTYAPKWGCRHESESAWESFSWLVAADHADAGEQEAWSKLSIMQSFCEGISILVAISMSVVYTCLNNFKKMPEITLIHKTGRPQSSTFVTLVVHGARGQFSWT